MFRPVKFCDLMRIMTIRNEGAQYSVSGQHILSAEQQYLWWITHQGRSNSIMFVLEVEGDVVGYSTIDYRGNGVCDVGFYVGWTYRGCGYGHELVRRTIDYCIYVMRLNYVCLELLDTNVRARNLYELYGFVARSSRVINRLDSPTVVLTMGLTVPESRRGQ